MNITDIKEEKTDYKALFHHLLAYANENVEDVIMEKNEIIARMADDKIMYITLFKPNYTKEEIELFEFDTPEAAEKFRADICKDMDTTFYIEKQPDTGLFKLVSVENISNFDKKYMENDIKSLDELKKDIMGGENDEN